MIYSNSFELEDGPAPESSSPKTGVRAAGFTLIELLVVIAILALLAAIILPTLSRAKQAGYNAVCVSNLHQWALALNMYVQDCSVYPPPISLPGEPRIWSKGCWYMRLRDYAQAGPLLGGWTVGKPGLPSGLDVCPGYLRLPGVFDPRVDPGSGLPKVATSYSYNSLGQWGQQGKIEQWGTQASDRGGLGLFLLDPRPARVRPVRESEVACPSDMIAIGDCFVSAYYLQQWYSINTSGITITPFRPHNMWGWQGDPDGEYFPVRLTDNVYQMRGTSGSDPGAMMDVYPGITAAEVLRKIQDGVMRRHRGQWNMSFCDGHVTSFPTPILFDLRRGETFARWNRDHQPHN